MENSAPSLKIFRTKFSTSALYNGRNKNRRQNPVWEFTKTIIPFALVGYEVIITNSRYALVGYFITSYPTRAHGIIVIYSLIDELGKFRLTFSRYANCDLEPVSWKARKLFGPLKPFLVHLYLKTEKCIRLRLLVWREPLFILIIRE